MCNNRLCSCYTGRKMNHFHAIQGYISLVVLSDGPPPVLQQTNPHVDSNKRCVMITLDYI